MTTHPDRVDHEGRTWTWDHTQNCYRYDVPDGGTWFSTKAALDENNGLGPEFRAILVKVATGELTVDEVIRIARRHRGQPPES